MKAFTDKTPALPGRWTGGAELPNHVKLGAGTIVSGDIAFRRFQSRRDPGLLIGAGCTMDGVQFAIGENGQLSIGDRCFFSNAILLCELEIRIGSHVMIGWNASIADTDFHPISPTERMADAIACSPLGKGHVRPKIECKRVVIGDDVYIGPAATILKGVTIGNAAWVEPGTMVTRDVPAGARVLGNPAKVVPFEEPGA